MCYPFCIWSNVVKVHPKNISDKKVKFHGFRYRTSFVENKNK